MPGKIQRIQLLFANSFAKTPKVAAIPILLIIGRYKMSQFYELRRHMENIASIITPFNQEEIRTRIDEILGTA